MFITPLLIDIFAWNFQGWSASYWNKFPPIFMQIGQSLFFGLFWPIVLVKLLLNVSYSPGDWEHGQLTSHKKFQLNISKIHEDMAKFRFSAIWTTFGPKFHCNSSCKQNVVSRQKEGLINLHQKFELDISKNARDIAQYLPESTMYACFHCIVCTADKMTS